MNEKLDYFSKEKATKCNYKQSEYYKYIQSANSLIQMHKKIAVNLLQLNV